MKHLLLVITLVLSTESWATAQSCSAFLQSPTKISSIARINPAANSRQNLNVIFSREKTYLDSDFTNRFLTGLVSFFAGKSTTTSRLEERAVIGEDESRELLDSSELNWVARDQKNEGEDFTTITTYSGKFVLASDSDVKVSAKLRARKYYAHDIGETNTARMSSIFNDVGSLELKISNVAGVDAEGFTIFSNSVFKPRVFIYDASLKKLSKMTHRKLSAAETREQMITEIYLLENAEAEQMNPDLDQVTAFVDALIMLLAENPNLFEVQTVIAYNRDSYSAFTENDPENGSEYQYTLDRNIRIYEPDSSLSASNISSYLDKTPLHAVEDGVAFAELKSPMMEKIENTTVYQRLSHALFSRHRQTFEQGKGKHSLGSKIRSTLAQTTLSEQLHTEGLLYYLIKGVGNTPTPPNRNHLVKENKWEISMPVEINSEMHKLILGYEPNNNVNNDGMETSLLRSIGLVDSLGRKVNLNSKDVSEIINLALESSEPSSVIIDNQVLTFPSTVGHDTIQKFKDFFDRFYKGFDKGRANPREVSSLYVVNNSAQLAIYNRRMNLKNRLSFLKDRAFKYAPAGIFGAFLAFMTWGPTFDVIPNEPSQTLAIGETRNVVVQDGDYTTNLVGNVLPDGRIQIVPMDPITAATSQPIIIDSNSIDDIQVGSESDLVPGTITLIQEPTQE